VSTTEFSDGRANETGFVSSQTLSSFAWRGHCARNGGTELRRALRLPAGRNRIAARCSIVTFLFLVLPACQPPAPATEKLEVERSALATPMFVQVAYSVPQIPRSFVPVSYAEAQTAGDLNVVVVGWNDTVASVQSVSDSAGNVYSRAIGPTTGAGLQQSIYYAPNIAGGNNTVTVQFNQPAVYPDIRILEYQGVSAVDVTTGTSGNGTTASSGTATTKSANELIFGAATVGSYVSGAGAGFTARIITSPDGDIAEDEVVTTTGNYSA